MRFGAKNDNDTAMVILTDKDRKPLAVGSPVRLENSAGNVRGWLTMVKPILRGSALQIRCW